MKPGSSSERAIILAPKGRDAAVAATLIREAGFYAKHGLDVKLDFGVHPVGLAGLVSGEIQFTNYSIDDTGAKLRDPACIWIHDGAVP